MIAPKQPAQPDEVARHYNDLDEFYRDVWGEHVHHGFWVTGRESADDAVENLVHDVVRSLGLESGQQVCDVGCGYGGTSRLLAREYGAHVTGLTVSEAQCEFANRESDGLPVRFLVCPWEQNSFEPDSFDAVVSIECVSHINDKSEYFRQIQRVLRPGGRASVVAWLANENSGKTAVRHLLEPICREGRLPGMATSDEYRSMIAANGLVLDEFENISRSVRKTWRICARRLLGKLMTRAKYAKALFDRRNSNRVFVLTLFRILIAYYTGSMRYGIFRIHKPETESDVAGRS